MEGHLLPGRTRIVSVTRDPATYRVCVTTSDGAQWTVPGDVRVLVLHDPQPEVRRFTRAMTRVNRRTSAF
jgi:hypothetical protein